MIPYVHPLYFFSLRVVYLIPCYYFFIYGLTAVLSVSVIPYVHPLYFFSLRVVYLLLFYRFLY